MYNNKLFALEDPPRFKVYPLIFLLAMLSCSTIFATEPPSIPFADPKLLKSTPEKNPLYSLALAEIAINRGLYLEALPHYLKAAHLSQDAKVAEEATLLAVALEAPAESIEAAQLWANNAPKNVQAQLVATSLLIGQSKEKAIPYLRQAIQEDPSEVEKNITEMQTMLSENGARHLEEATALIASEQPDNAHAQLISALCSATLGHLEEATNRVNRALQKNPSFVAAIELKARLIYQESEPKALEYLQGALKKHPSEELQFFYANALLDASEPQKAKELLTPLMTSKIFGGSALILLSEIAFDRGDLELAIRHLKQSLHFKDTRDSASYLLGQLDEQRGDYEHAIFWYSTIDAGPYHVPGVLKAIHLLKKQKEFDTALTLIQNSTPTTQQEQKELLISEVELLNLIQKPDKAFSLVNDLLEKLPGDHEFLIMRALTAIHLNNFTLAEKDVRLILASNPSNANALSLLGHILSQNEKRLNEALTYLKQALALSPNNPAFMDSTGWTYYRLGNLSQAISYLEKAHSLTEDSEVAAHFGEVLWVKDQKQEAISIWKKAFENDPNDRILLETLKRLNVTLP